MPGVLAGSPVAAVESAAVWSIAAKQQDQVIPQSPQGEVLWEAATTAPPRQTAWARRSPCAASSRRRFRRDRWCMGLTPEWNHQQQQQQQYYIDQGIQETFESLGQEELQQDQHYHQLQPNIIRKPSTTKSQAMVEVDSGVDRVNVCGQTSFEVFMRFVRPANADYSTDDEVDASGILSRECYEAWLKTRRSLPKDSPRAFKDALKSIVMANNRCKPFPNAVERDLLRHLRAERVWPCFENDSSVQIGKRGWKIKGFHERQAEEGHNSIASTSSSSMSNMLPSHRSSASSSSAGTSAAASVNYQNMQPMYQPPPPPLMQDAHMKPYARNHSAPAAYAPFQSRHSHEYLPLHSHGQQYPPPQHQQPYYQQQQQQPPSPYYPQQPPNQQQHSQHFMPTPQYHHPYQHMHNPHQQHFQQQQYMYSGEPFSPDGNVNGNGSQESFATTDSDGAPPPPQDISQRQKSGASTASSQRMANNSSNEKRLHRSSSSGFASTAMSETSSAEGGAPDARLSPETKSPVGPDARQPAHSNYDAFQHGLFVTNEESPGSAQSPAGPDHHQASPTTYGQGSMQQRQQAWQQEQQQQPQYYQQQHQQRPFQYQQRQQDHRDGSDRPAVASAAELNRKRAFPQDEYAREQANLKQVSKAPPLRTRSADEASTMKLPRSRQDFLSHVEAAGASPDNSVVAYEVFESLCTLPREAFSQKYEVVQQLFNKSVSNRLGELFSQNDPRLSFDFICPQKSSVLPDREEFKALAEYAMDGTPFVCVSIDPAFEKLTGVNPVGKPLMLSNSPLYDAWIVHAIKQCRQEVKLAQGETIWGHSIVSTRNNTSAVLRYRARIVGKSTNKGVMIQLTFQDVTDLYANVVALPPMF